MDVDSEHAQTFDPQRPATALAYRRHPEVQLSGAEVVPEQTRSDLVLGVGQMTGQRKVLQPAKWSEEPVWHERRGLSKFTQNQRP